MKLSPKRERQASCLKIIMEGCDESDDVEVEGDEKKSAKERMKGWSGEIACVGMESQLEEIARAVRARIYSP